MGVGRKGVGRWAVAVLGCVALLLVLAPAALAAEGTGTIAGKVTEAPDAGVGGVNVEVITANREFVGFAITEESGKYEVTGLAAGSYKVEFVPKNGSMDAPQFYSGKPSFSEATEVAVQAGMTHSEVNAELHEGGMIAGTVTGVGADGLEHVSVFVSIAGEEFISGSAVTGAGGKYKVTGLPTGSYTVEFHPEYGFGLNFVSQYYDEAPLFSEATKVPVTEGKSTKEINAKLQEGGEISGVVTDAATHKPLVKAYVSAYRIVGGVEEEEGFEDYAETNASGEYTIVGLGSGTYKVEFEGSGTGTEYITQFYNDEPTFQSAGLVTASQGSTTPGIDAALLRKAPVDTVGPVASGTPAVGKTLSCSIGSWTGSPTLTYAYTWLRNGAAIAGASAGTYVVQTADQATGLACKVTASNKHGSAGAVSNTLVVPPPPPPPPPTPVIELLSARIVASGGSARVPLACAKATCTGTIELTERILLARRHRGRTRFRSETIVLGKGVYALSASHSATIFVPLTRTGKRALARARHHRLLLTARVSVTGGTAIRESVLLSELVHRRRR